MPAISVVMPVYNRSGSVRAAIDSVLASEFRDFELIVVDDGSADDTADVVEAVDDSRVRCLRQPRNMGGNVARNRGIRESDSPLICFIDSDDLFLPKKLGFLVEFYRQHPEVDALVDSFRIFYPPETGRAPADRINPELWDSAEIERAVFSRKLFKATPALSARRAALDAIGLFDETLKRRQDFDLILRLAREKRCASTAEVLWEKRWSEDSISAKQDTFATAMIEMCERHPVYLTRKEFRSGLARDMVRHFLRLLAKGQIGTAAKDLGRCARFFGLPRLTGLMGAGVVELLRRAVTRRAA